MSAAAEFTVFLIGSDVLADRSLHRHLAKQFTDAVIHRENDSMTRALQETYHFDKLLLAWPSPTPGTTAC